MKWLSANHALTSSWCVKLTITFVAAAVITAINFRFVIQQRYYYNVPHGALPPQQPLPLPAAAPAPPPPSPPPASNQLLIVVRTCPKYYDSRLLDVLETHLRDVPSELIMPVGNNAKSLSVQGPAGTSRHINVLPTDGSNTDGKYICEDNHGPGIVCIEGRALFYAYERRDLFDWMFMVDDDVYVHHQNLQGAVRRLDPNARHVYTVGGCAPTVTCASHAGGGICGGGGWLMSKQNLVRVMEHDGGLGSTYANRNVTEERLRNGKNVNLGSWMDFWMETGAGIAKEDGSWWSDITAGCVMNQRAGVTVQTMSGLHPWTVERKTLHNEINNGSPPPISYHYVHRDEMPGMRGLHDIVVGSTKASRSETTNASSSNSTHSSMSNGANTSSVAQKETLERAGV